MRESPGTPSNLPSDFWLKSGILLAAFLVAYYSTIQLLVRTWTGRDEYSHGFLVPFISFYMAWANRVRIAQIPTKPALYSGLLLSLFSGFILLAGHIGGVAILQELSLLLMIPGIILLILGYQHLKALALPLGYLAFMVPVIDPLLDRVRLPLQLITAKFSGLLLNLIGIATYQHQQFLELSHITLEVADICSGAGYLVTLFAIAIPLAYLTQRNWGSRVLLLAITPLIAILNNIVRVTIIGIWTTHNVGADIHGPRHIMQGFFVAVLGYIMLFILAWVLARRGPSVQDAQITAHETTDKHVSSSSKAPSRTWLLAVVTLLSFGAYLHLYNSDKIPLKTDLIDFPPSIGEWVQTGTGNNLDISDTIPADAALRRTYRNPSGSEISLYVGYFEAQRQDRELVHYKLSKLYNNSKEVQLAYASGQFPVNRAVLKSKEEQDMYSVVYWYNLDGKIVANNYKAKLMTILSGLVHRRTNGAIIIISRKTQPGEDMKTGLNTDLDFARQVIPVSTHYLP